MKSIVVKSLLVICSVSLLTGCMFHKATSLEPRKDGDQAIVLSKKISGIYPGICGFRMGTDEVDGASIRLIGQKDRYDADEFVVVPNRTSDLIATNDKDSYIQIDRRARIVKISIRQNGEAFPWNGRRHYIEAAE